MLASQMALPCERHFLDVVFRVFNYLKAKHNLRLVVDLSYLEIDYIVFPDHDWSFMYGDVKEVIPRDTSYHTCGKKKLTYIYFVDSLIMPV